MSNILITTSTFGEISASPLDLLSQRSSNVILNPYKRKLTEGELSELIEKFNPIGIIAGTERYTKEILDQSTNLKCISRVGVGTDGIDSAHARERQIKISITSSCISLAVAELTIGLMFSAARRISMHAQAMSNHEWKKNMGFLFHGKTVGIIGFGNIGKIVASKSALLGANVIAYDPITNSDAFFPSVNFMPSLNDLLGKADIASFHCPYIKNTPPLINKSNIHLLKKGITLINTARGELLDQASMLIGLREGIIDTLALDVFTEEPYSGPYCDLKNVILTPHIGSYARETRVQMETEAVENLIKAIF